ncbi:universal stress protein [Pseudonocardia sp. KRD-184]|uniref:Universal stress protein n=1 Tax=Pseudonocardia oceani TaxID=2792013 RepID=A0ABS6UHF4_9PSEU|nr:universal stress protein [Pseudonocardia oceani]MBW0093864.1 universal stress protein [Pseudonocardia oceani]MBW0096028.1 universal stress protein [Pseudonocardia oceani]MBW0111835.1 universal stress protein [Pseudonocardia oceani]MBW0122947.1 universal stress protein [Pseudonocardia oceani]MBW0131690.1 universal stress protein [Pseudonocardia oceani]
MAADTDPVLCGDARLIERVALGRRRAGRSVVVADEEAAGAPAPRPGETVVLVTRPDAHRAGPLRVVAAVRELPAELPVVDEAADVASELGAELVIAHAVPLSFGERSIGVDTAVDRGRATLDAARARVADHAPRLRVTTSLTRRWAHELLGEGLDADLLVVGRRRSSAQLGLVSHSAVRHAPCPVLLVPRS